MSAFLTALFIIVFFVLAIILLGLYLMSKMVGGFGNLRAIYRLFTGKGRTYNNHSKTDTKNAQTSGKMFGQNEGTYVEFEEVND